jgi:hypothetical protein
LHVNASGGTGGTAPVDHLAFAAFRRRLHPADDMFVTECGDHPGGQHRYQIITVATF